MSIATLISGGLGSFGNIATLLEDGLAQYTGLPQPPPFGYQYETYGVGTPYSGSGDSIQQGASPADVVGNVGITQLVTSPNSFSVTINSDGTLDILSGGNTSRQQILYGRYILGSNALDPSNFPASTATIWVNEVGPIWAKAVILPTSGLIVLGAPLSVILQSSTYASSPEGDTLSFAVTSGSLPPGLSIVSGQIVGTPSAIGSYSFTLSATDITGTFTVSPQGSISVQALPTPPAGMPTFIGMEYFQALAALSAAGFQSSPPVEVNVAQNAPGGQSGYVIGQSIAPGAPFVSGSTITLTVAKKQFPAVEQNEPIPYWYFLQR